MNSVRIRNLRSRAISRQGLQNVAVLLAVLCVIYQLPVSAVVAMQDNFRIGTSASIVSYRIMFGMFTAAVLALNVIANKHKLLELKITWLYAAFLAYIILVVMINRDLRGFTSSIQEYDTSALDYFKPIVFYYILYALLGIHLIDMARWRNLFLLVVIASMLSIYPYMSMEALGIDRSRFADDANIGNYLFIGDAFAICSLLIIAWYKNQFFRLAFAAFAAVTLFLVGSRTAFVLFVFSFVFYTVVLFRVRWLLSLVAVFIVGYFYIQSLDYDALASRNSRMLYIFTDYENDNSVRIRAKGAEEGWADIFASPILGNFGGQLELNVRKPNWTAYVHSVVSYWRQFGVFAILAIGIFYLQFAKLAVQSFSRRHSLVYATCVLPGTFIITEMILSRAFSFSISHVLFGLIIVFSAYQVSASRDSRGRSGYSQRETVPQPSRRRVGNNSLLN